MNIIIIGKMTSGKTTVANLLLKELTNSKKLTLAGPIYDIVTHLDWDNRRLLDKFILPYYDPRNLIEQNMGLEISDQFFEKWDRILEATRKLPDEKPKPRKRLQYMGTNGARTLIDKDIWIRIALNKARQEPDTTWIIDDCRFKNEYKAFIKNGWKPLFLHIPKDVQHQRLTELYGKYDPKILQHQSELEIDEICIPTKYIINANQNIDKELKDIKDIL